jgi:hypothetical protein
MKIIKIKDLSIDLFKFKIKIKKIFFRKLDISISVPNTAATTVSSFVWQEKKESSL